MRNSIFLMVVEYVIWTSGMSFLSWAIFNILKKLIKEDLSQSKEIDYLYRYSSIIGIISSAIFAVLIY